MCGVWGFVSSDGDGPDLARLGRIIRETETRGIDAFGFAWIDQQGRLHAYRESGRLSARAGCLGWIRDAVMVIGHARAATHGDPEHNINNHPHAADGGWIVHNGVVRNYQQLMRRGELVGMVSECDSEVLGRMIEAGAGDLSERCAATAMAVDPLAAFAMLGLWSRPGKLVAIRRGNPLHLGRAGEGWYIGSLLGGLPPKAGAIAPHGMLTFTQESDEVRCEFSSIDAVGAFEFADDAVAD